MWGKQKDKLWYDKEVWHIKIVLAYVTCYCDEQKCERCEAWRFWMQWPIVLKTKI